MTDQEYFDYLNTLRESGVTNMMAAPAFLQEQFDVDRRESCAIFLRWTETFND